MEKNWLEKLVSFIKKKPLIVLQISGYEWERLSGAQRGAHEFTIARSHDLFENARFPTACLVFGNDDESSAVYFGIVTSRAAVTTLQTRIKLKSGKAISPNSKSAILDMVKEKPHAKNLQDRIGSTDPVVVLSPNLSVHIIRKLARIDSNIGHIRAISNALVKEEHSSAHSACQEDAVKMALRAFGFSHDDEAISIEIIKGEKTALRGIMEDSVIEHDARVFPGYEFIASDVTGKAMFRKNNQRLEIITANRRLLEKVFGVDLIYFNRTMNNIVMVQYKMLEPYKAKKKKFDWIYYPDNNLDKEILRMKKFAKKYFVDQHEYRLNQQPFYFKFVRRNNVEGKKGILIPLDHFEKLKADPACQGPKGAFRVSFNSLGGRYLRQQPFYHLIRAGYIGSSAEATNHFEALIKQTLAGNRALIAAVQSGDPFSPDISADD